MNENIDLIKILDGCPEGTEFYSDTFGKLFFYCIEPAHSLYRVAFRDRTDRYCPFRKNGTFYANEDPECPVNVFPSKNQRDWSKFVRFWDKPKIERFDPKTLQPFDKVLMRTNSMSTWEPDFFGYIDGGWFMCVTTGNVQCIPYNEDTKHLIGTKEEAPEYYRYWEDE